MGQEQTTGKYTECPSVDLERGDDDSPPPPLYIQCRDQLLGKLERAGGMLQSWDGLLVDHSLRYLMYNPQQSCWDEIKDLRGLLVELGEGGQLLRELEDPWEVYTQERALKEKFDFYQFKLTQLRGWARLAGSPHLKKILT